MRTADPYIRRTTAPKHGHPGVVEVLLLISRSFACATSASCNVVAVIWDTT